MSEIRNQANQISHRIRDKQSSSSEIKKYNSLRNLLESLDELDDKYQNAEMAERALSNYRVENENGNHNPRYDDLCAQLQYEYVQAIKVFHQGVYECVSQLMNFVKIMVAERYRRNIQVNSVEHFYTSLEISSDLILEISTLKESRDFRTFVNHPEQHSGYDWMTVGGPSERSLVHYFDLSRTDEIPIPPSLDPNVDSINPPKTETTYIAFKRFLKNTLRKFTD